MYFPKRNNTVEKYRRINQRFEELYVRDERGIRPNIDDVIKLIAKEFCISKYTVERILRTPNTN